MQNPRHWTAPKSQWFQKQEISPVSWLGGRPAPYALRERPCEIKKFRRARQTSKEEIQ
jgi:hypothetical protein